MTGPRASATLLVFTVAACQAVLPSRRIVDEAADGDGSADAGWSAPPTGPVEGEPPDPRDEPEGEGTTDSPFVLRRCAELQAMDRHLDAWFVLAADVDCTGFSDGDGLGFRPVGSVGAPFTGSLDGAAHEISGIAIRRTEGGPVGLFGELQGSVRNLALSGEVQGAGPAGVLAGSMEGGTVSGCRFDGAVQSTGAAGGVAGEAAFSTLGDLYSRVAVATTHPQAGLLVAVAAAVSLSRVYSTGRTAGTQRLVGVSNAADVIASYFDCDNAGGCDTPDPAARHSAELESAPFLAYRGWNFREIWGNTGPSTPPCLLWEKGCTPWPDAPLPLAGAGTPGAPYAITTCADLQSVLGHRGAWLELAGPVDCAGFDFGQDQGFLPIGEEREPFAGHLDGRGHVVSRLRIERPDADDVGLFGHIAGTAESRASVKDLGLEGFTVEGRARVGALAGSATYVDISRAYAKGNLHGRSLTGGLVGRLEGQGIVRNSYTATSIASIELDGGLLVAEIGRLSLLETSYATGWFSMGGSGIGHVNVAAGGKVTSSFCSADAEKTCSDGVRDSQLRSAGFLVSRGWDFEAVWGLGTDSGTACLLWEPDCS